MSDSEFVIGSELALCIKQDGLKAAVLFNTVVDQGEPLQLSKRIFGSMGSDRIKYVLLAGIVLLVLQEPEYSVLATVPSSAHNSFRNSANVQPLRRPSPQFLYASIKQGRALIDVSYKKDVAELLLQMDRVHSSLLETPNVVLIGNKASKAWISGKTDTWPVIAPQCERTIWVLLQLQIETLDRILQRKNSTLSAALKEGSQKKRVRKAHERFFKDFRDRFICMVLDALKEIAGLQNALGVVGTIRFDFPSNVQNTQELQSFLVEKIRLVADRANRIRSFDQTD